MGLIKRAYRYRCYPTSEQRMVLARAFGCCRWALARKTTAYREAGQHLSYGDLQQNVFGVWLGVGEPGVGRAGVDLSPVWHTPRP